MAAEKPSVLIYRFSYLPLSQTFIADHIRSLRGWRPLPIYERLNSEATDVPPATPIAAQSGLLGRIERYMLTRPGISMRLDQIVRRERPRLIHAHFLTDTIRCIAYAKRSGLPLIATAHGVDASLYDDELRKTVSGRHFLDKRQALIDAVSTVLCVSNFIRDELLKRGYPSEKLIVQRLGINLAEFQPGKPAGQRSGALFVGRLVEKKCPTRVIDAWKTLPTAVRAQGLTIIGGGPDEAICREKAADCPDIKLLGPQPRDVVRRIMAESRVLVMPSLRARNGDSEGLPVVAMEGQAVGTPIVTFDQPPMSEAIRDRMSGLAVSQSGDEPLAEAINRILEDDALATRLGEGGIRNGADAFDLMKNTSALEGLYERFGQSA